MQRQNALSDLEDRTVEVVDIRLPHMFEAMFTASKIDLAQNCKLAPAAPNRRRPVVLTEASRPPSHLPASIISFQRAALHGQTTHSTSFTGLCLMGGRWHL
jgi:hypothetical protein